MIQYRRESTWIFDWLRTPEDDRQRAVQALLPDLAKSHPICVEDLERWRVIAQQPLNEICPR